MASEILGIFMSNYSRFAIYYLLPNGPLADFGASWLGWDVETGTAAAHPDLPLDVAAITETPRKYGLHGTLKPPFRLNTGLTQADVETAAADLAAKLAPVEMQALTLSNIGRFIALTAVGDASDLTDLATACVVELDHLRAPATDAELARRRAAGLTDRQDAYLMEWGYPYVMEDFKFHITLSGKLDADTAARTTDALTPILSPLLPAPFVINDIGLVGERADGRFEVIQRYTLSSDRA